MVEATDVRRLALVLQGVTDASEAVRLVFEIGGRGLAWTYFERVQPNKPRVIRPDVLAVRCEIERKEMLIAAAPQTYFDDDHYRGYPAVLVRLAAIEEAELAALMEGARQLAAPNRRPKRKPGVTLA